ncbi:DUF4097 family beta strand repeat-containing protein [Kribbella sp. NPDC000426]|uniref:DUF4097 family beta strand repeat-containing protein n=1 Tax=Kribbella sp. NPDC000426 TaxID=3154255 RepID=UPI003328D9E6
MTSAQRRMLIIGLVPLLVLVIAAAAVTVSVIRGKLPYSYSAAFAPGADGAKITADVPTEVLASVDGKVHVSVDGTYAAAMPDVKVSTVGGQLLVETRCPDLHCSVDLTVEVPAAEAVQAKVDTASINVVGVSSPLNLAVSDGSVDLVRARSPRVSVDVQRGSATLGFDSAPDQVSATTSDGSLTVLVPQTATYAIDAVAAQGSTDLHVPNDPSATRHLHLRSSYGSITVQ